MRFFFVDEILDLVPGKSIRASKTLGADEDVFRDHFPGFPVVPGVLLTEMMAQTAGKCLDSERKSRGKAMLIEIAKAKFRDWVRPDQKATITAEIKVNRERYASASCEVEVEGKKICSSDLFFTFAPYDRFASGYRDEVLESYLEKRQISETL